MALQCHPLMVIWEHCVKWPLGSHSANSRLLYVIGKGLRRLQGLSLPIQLVSKAEIWLTVFFGTMILFSKQLKNLQWRKEEIFAVC